MGAFVVPAWDEGHGAGGVHSHSSSIENIN